MTAPTPDDYNAADGYNEDRGWEQCPHCERQLAGESGYHGPVWDQSGQRYEHPLNTEPGTAPLFCEECWPTLETNRRQDQHASLSEFGGGGR